MPAEPVSELWGPRVYLGYAFYRLDDGHGGGQVHGGQFGGYAPLEWFRLGGMAELAVRKYTLGSDDLVIRVGLEAGIQHAKGWGPLHPYAVLQASFGITLLERFSTTLKEPIRGAGLAIGADLQLSGPLHVGVSLGYQRLAVGDLAHDVWEFRLRFGL